MGIVRYFPHLKIVLQDLPDQIALAKVVWSEKAKEAIDLGAVEFIDLDFFKESPKQGCDIYYVSFAFVYVCIGC